jgi:AcrR family transcriptional regulator
MPKVVPEYKEIAKNRIINAAYIIFNSKGYHNSTMDDIAHVVGVSKASLYSYFKSKEEILQTATKESLKKSFIDFLEDESSPEPLNDLYNDMVKFGDILHLNFEIIALSPHNDDISKINVEIYEKKLDTLTEFIKKQQVKGKVRNDVDAVTLAHIINALYLDLALKLIIGFNKTKIRKSWDKSISTILKNNRQEDQKTLNKYF